MKEREDADERVLGGDLFLGDGDLPNVEGDVVVRQSDGFGESGRSPAKHHQKT